MSRFEHTIPAAYFDGLYASDRDPWGFATSAYEAQKYAATLNALPNPRYASALEIGCSIGVLTQQLAPRCERLLSIDIAEGALMQARARCADLPHVAFELAQVPRDWPSGCFDLIVMSEIVYYLDGADVELLARRVSQAVTSGGAIVLVHWLGETNYPLTGDQAAEGFIASIGGKARILRQTREAAYRLDVLRAA